MKRRQSISGPSTGIAVEAAIPSSEYNGSNVALSKNMVVAVRVRPLSLKEKESGQSSCVSILSNSIVAIRRRESEVNGGAYLTSQKGSISEYAFDTAFDETVSQYGVYAQTAKPFIRHVVGGQNVTVFAYGATGAGKTHTMLGNTREDEAAGDAEAGIISNSISDIFSLLESKKSSLAPFESYQVAVQFIEVYNEQVYDLLETSGGPLPLREDSERGVVVAAGAVEEPANSVGEVMGLLSLGNKNRKTEATMANLVSSRSHAVLQVIVRHCKRSDCGRESVVESRLSLIDLAGSERASSTCNRGARLHEGANINKSLLALANCINALAERGSAKKTNVKYRDSKLTHLLKSSLEGNCHLVMICNINPSHLTFEDSHNTLKYANRAKNIRVDPTATEKAKESSWLLREQHLREENAMLRERVRRLEMLILEMSGGAMPAELDGGLLEPGAVEAAAIASSASKKRSFDSISAADEQEENIVEAVVVAAAAVVEEEDPAETATGALSDSFLASGLFSSNDDGEMSLLVDSRLLLKANPIASRQPLAQVAAASKKRRGSFIPMPAAKAAPKKAAAPDAPPLADVRRSSRQRLSLGAADAPKARQENTNPNLAPAQPSNLSLDKAVSESTNSLKRRKSLADVSSMLDNVLLSSKGDEELARAAPLPKPLIKSSTGSVLATLVSRVTRRQSSVAAQATNSTDHNGGVNEPSSTGGGNLYWGDI